MYLYSIYTCNIGNNTKNSSLLVTENKNFKTKNNNILNTTYIYNAPK